MHRQSPKEAYILGTICFPGGKLNSCGVRGLTTHWLHFWEQTSCLEEKAPWASCWVEHLWPRSDLQSVSQFQRNFPSNFLRSLPSCSPTPDQKLFEAAQIALGSSYVIEECVVMSPWVSLLFMSTAMMSIRNLWEHHSVDIFPKYVFCHRFLMFPRFLNYCSFLASLEEYLHVWIHKAFYSEL